MARFNIRSTICAAAVGLAAFVAFATVAAAQEKAKRQQTERRGGYSYNQADTINTYGDTRGRYGRTEAFRDPNIDRQTNFGPFDNGFFFDSGIGPRGGNSPYLN